MTNSVIVIPAYNRDYKTATDAFADWTGGKDFKISDVSNRWNGKYCSVRDFGPEVEVKIRYNKLADFCFIRGGGLIEGVEPDEIQCDYQPNWKQVSTANDIQLELKGFTFKGPGWYHTKTDSMLVIPLNRPIDKLWEPSTDLEELYEFHVFNGYNPLKMFGAIMAAPEQQNDV